MNNNREAPDTIRSIVIAVLFLIPAIGCDHERNPVNRARLDMRTFALAIEAYHEANGKFPPWAIGPDSINQSDIPSLSKESLKQFSNLVPDSPEITNGMTKNGIFRDPFVGTDTSLSYYYRDSDWVIWSAGPNGRYELNLDVLRTSMELTSDLFVDYRYDPTNGSSSTGDLIIFRKDIVY